MAATTVMTEPAARPGERALVLPPPRRRRSLALVLAGVVLAAVCAVAAVSLARTGDDLVSVIGVASPVRFGEPIPETALRPVAARLDPGLRPVRWVDRDRLIGQVATTDLLPGSLITEAVVSGQPPVPAGSVVVGVAVRATQLPATAMTPRGLVLLVPSAATAGVLPEQWLPVRGMVLRVGDRDATGVRVVDVVVPADDGPQLASRASTGQVAIVLLPQGR